MAVINNNKHFPVWLFKLRSMNTVTVFQLTFMNSYNGKHGLLIIIFTQLCTHMKQGTKFSVSNGSLQRSANNWKYSTWWCKCSERREGLFSSLQEKYSSFPVVIFTLEFFRQGRNKCPCQQKHGPSGLVSQWPHSTGQSWRVVSEWNVHS